MAALNFPSPAAGGDIYQGTNGVTYIFISDGAGGGYWSGASAANNEAPNIDIGNDPPPFPKEGDLWWDSTVTSGRLYVYYEDGDSNQWVEASPAAGEDSIDNLWKKVGNDLSPIEDTDNVLIGGGDIKLNADGSGTFAGNVDVGNYPNEGVRLSSAGVVNVKRTSGFQQVAVSVANVDVSVDDATFKVVAGGSTFIGGDLSQSGGNVPTGANISLNADGSATFSGTGVAVSATGLANFRGYSGTNFATITSEIAADGTTKIGGTLPDAPNITLLANGGAKFSATTSITRANISDYCLKVKQDTKTGGLWVADGTLYVGGDLDIASLKPNITLNADGSAEFAGGNTEILSDGALRVKRSTGNGSLGIAIYPDNDYTANATAVINTDGSAAFAAGLNINNAPVASNVALNVKVDDILNNGLKVISTTTGADAGGAFTATDSNGVLQALTRSTGDVLLGNINAAASTANIKLTSLTGSAEFAGTVTADNVSFNLEADDDTKYTSTTDVDGNETLVYNGDVLDVKELLLTLRTAASRIETLETAKASLEARLTALEGAN